MKIIDFENKWSVLFVNTTSTINCGFYENLLHSAMSFAKKLREAEAERSVCSTATNCTRHALAGRLLQNEK